MLTISIVEVPLSVSVLPSPRAHFNNYSTISIISSLKIFDHTINYCKNFMIVLLCIALLNFNFRRKLAGSKTSNDGGRTSKTTERYDDE